MKIANKNTLFLLISVIGNQSTTFAWGPRRMRLAVTDSAKEQVLTEAAADIQYGARHLKRYIDHQIVQNLSVLIADNKVKDGDRIVVDYNTGHFTFSKPASSGVQDRMNAAPG